MLRPYQIELANKASQILNEFNIVYLAMEMRVGKTLISLKTADLVNAENVLFVTKKKAISSIIKDYQREKFNFKLKVTNYEQLNKLDAEYDLIIVDEAHSLGAFPKPSERTKYLKRLVDSNKLILLSGTPTPETYSQIYHQLWISNKSPFIEKNFYKWAKVYVDIKGKYINGVKFNDYTNAKKDLIMAKVNHLLLTFTRDDAGFSQKDVQEEIITIPINKHIEKLISILNNFKYYKLKDGSEIVCDTSVKLQSKIHQICSGTVKTEDGKYHILDDSKARYIQDNYKNQKVAIFYKFIAEGDILKKTLTDWTESPDQFHNHQYFLSQIQSGSMGINLSIADVLIFYNIDFSSVQYWQARARLQALERVKVPFVHWIFTDKGIENKIYKVVQKKKDYTNYYFKRDYGIEVTKSDNQILKKRRSLCS